MYLTSVNLILGIASHVIIAITVGVKNKWDKMFLSYFCFPFYWLLHYVASYGALIQFFRAPHYWNKTEHGKSKLLAEESNI